jgi:hypothetical protein
MMAKPKSRPAIWAEMSGDEAAALVRAIERAIDPITKAGNHLDVKRFKALRLVLSNALDGHVTEAEVEP